MVKGFFRDLSQQPILPGSFGSVTELVDIINRHLSQRNLQPKCYVWHADGKKFSTKSTQHNSDQQSCRSLIKEIQETGASAHRAKRVRRGRLTLRLGHSRLLQG
jgi:hypothetical protein